MGIEQAEMLSFFTKRLGHISYEFLCSGKGLPHIYEYYKECGRVGESAHIAELLAKANDRAVVIVNGALGEDPVCELCRATLDMFLSILCAEAGNLALTVMATGGVYIGGGILPRILDIFSGRQFLDSFSNKGRMTAMLENIPVHIITNPKAALLGAGAYGLQQENIGG